MAKEKEKPNPFPLTYPLFGENPFAQKDPIAYEEICNEFCNKMGLNESVNDKHKDQFIDRIMTCAGNYLHFQSQFTSWPSEALDKKILKKSIKKCQELESLVSTIHPICNTFIRRNISSSKVARAQNQGDRELQIIKELKAFQRAANKVANLLEPKPGKTKNLALQIFISEVAEIWEEYTNTDFNHSCNNVSKNIPMRPIDFAYLFSEIPGFPLKGPKIKGALRTFVNKSK